MLGSFIYFIFTSYTNALAASYSLVRRAEPMAGITALQPLHSRRTTVRKEAGFGEEHNKWVAMMKKASGSSLEIQVSPSGIVR